jgi:hypothetical protein
MDWPADTDIPLLDNALQIAMGYLVQTGQADDYAGIEHVVALVLLKSWRGGARHPVRLANDAIWSIENPGLDLPSPRRRSTANKR